MPDPLKDNPLLVDTSIPPRFDAIRIDHIEPAISAILTDCREALSAIEDSARPDWEDLVDPLERLSDRLGYAWGIVEHLMSVQNSQSLRDVYEKIEPQVVSFRTEAGQSRPVYDALRALRDGVGFARLDETQQRIVNKLIQSAELAGVALDGEERERFQAIQLELASLSTKFGNNLLDATKAFSLVLRQPEDIEGLPDSFLEMASQSARADGHPDATADAGPWRVTLDGPSYTGFMKYGANRALREQLYRAFVTRASEGELSNVPAIQRMLELRREVSSMLGFGSYAELSLSRKMAGSVREAERLLEELRVVSFGAANEDHVELTEFVRRDHGDETAENLRPWDIAFWSEKLREATFELNEEELRPYFPMPTVMEGLFRLASKLFGIRVVAADSEQPVWHEDVRFFKVLDEADEEIAAFYMDPYSRPAEKRGGAWMNEVMGRSGLFPRPNGRARLPVAYLICNGTPPVGSKPSLMTFRDIETLFHEFGHTLQHMLTQVDYGLASGIRNVEWDAVELPSQFMENFCYHRQTLLGLSAHVDTGETLPDSLFDKILAARTFRAGSGMLRQLHFGFIDLELHHRFDPAGSEGVFDAHRRIAEKTTVVPPIPEDRFLCGFSHIFQGGYAAGYYSYKWAEVLSADAFGAFEEAGLDDDDAVQVTGRRFRDTVLALGGSRPPSAVFAAFRGRPPSTEALLRHAGLSAA